jgi:hypothetical protein
MIAVALVAVLGLDLVFIHYSGTTVAALTFAVLGFTILLLLSATAGSFVPEYEDQTPSLGAALGSGPVAVVARVLLASCIPVLLMLAVVYIPDLDRSLVPSQGIRLGATAATFGLLASLPLAGAVLGFLWPRKGSFESVLVGGLVIADYAMLSWGTLGVDRETLQLALYDLMVWPVLSLIGAWVGMTLRQVSEAQLERAGRRAPSFGGRTAPLPVTLAPAPNAGFYGETPIADCQTYRPGQAGLTGV